MRTKIELMFERQSVLTDKYLEIEKKVLQEIDPPKSFDIDDPICQYICKNMAWRIIEELMEMMESLRKYSGEDAKEECIDALHFLLELLILTDVQRFLNSDAYVAAYVDVVKNSKDSVDVESALLDTVFYLGKSMHCLKNRPWKQTRMSTDREKFKHYITAAFYSWFLLADCLGMDLEEVYDKYMKKSDVNIRRQKEGY